MSDCFSSSVPARCPVLAVAPSLSEFRDWCATQHNLSVASSKTSVLISAMRALTSLLAEAKAVSASPEELADMVDVLRQHAEVIQAHLDAVSSQM